MKAIRKRDGKEIEVERFHKEDMLSTEDVIKYLRENPLKDITPEEFIDELLRDGQILMSDYLELQKAIELAKKPILEIKLSPEQMVWDIEKWLSYSKTQKIIFHDKEKEI